MRSQALGGGQVPHGTKIVVVDMTTLQILQTIQPSKKESIVDFALHNDGVNLTLATTSFVLPFGKSFDVGLQSSSQFCDQAHSLLGLQNWGATRVIVANEGGYA